jgi:hypothetical protein
MQALIDKRSKPGGTPAEGHLVFPGVVVEPMRERLVRLMGMHPWADDRALYDLAVAEKEA